MEIVTVTGAVLGAVAVLAWIAALLWAAVQDGRTESAVARRRPASGGAHRTSTR